MTKHYPVQLWDVDALVPYAKNAKIHTDAQVEKLANLIRKVGWTQPIILWKNGEIIAGHGRRMAAIKLGLAKVPAIVRDDLTEEEAKAMRLADNKIASTEYDQALVQIELQELFASEDFDIPITDIGYSEKDLEWVTSDLGEISDDFFVDDVGSAVEEQRKENEKAIEATDDVAAPVGDALGFKRVTIAQSRQIRELMTRIEGRYSEMKGPEALIDFITRALGDK